MTEENLIFSSVYAFNRRLPLEIPLHAPNNAYHVIRLQDFPAPGNPPVHINSCGGI